VNSFALAIIATVVLTTVVIVGWVIAMLKASMRQPFVQVIQLGTPYGAPPMLAPSAAPTQIKKAQCRTCGATKVRPPKSACMYCDYCGAFVDWDFRIAATTAGSAQPGPELRRLVAQEKAVQDRARAMGDRRAFRESVVRVYQQHMSACPAVYSPRIGDPAYRRAVLDYLAEADTATGFDPRFQALDAELDRAIAQMERAPGYGPPRVALPWFQRLVVARKATAARAGELLAPWIHMHPDKVTIELAVAVINSTFAQYWLPFLDPPQQEWLIAELGLAGEYVPLTQVATQLRHCGGCGGSLEVVAGARRVVCEACGHINDVEHAEIGCPHCGAPVSMVVGAPRLSCPYCRADLRVDGLGP
jgi:hypothetical protein